MTAPVVALVSPTPRTRLVSIDLQGTRFSYQPGQAVLVGVQGSLERRPYSIACSPEQCDEAGRLDLLIGIDEAGEPGPLLTGIAPGTQLDLEGPLGAFTFPAQLPQQRCLFVAGGTGIAPLRSMIDHALRRQPPLRLSLLYSARRADEFAFIEEFQAHAASGRIELHQTVTRDETASWVGRRGRVGRAHFEAVLHEPAMTLCFVCGPSAFVTESVAMLRTLGVADDLVRTEGWGR